MRFLDKIFHFAGVAGALLLASIAILTLVQIVGRSLGFLISTGTEFAGFCMAASTFLALAWTFRMGGHIRVALVLQKLPPSSRRWVEGWCLAVSGLAVGAFAYSSIGMAWDSYVFGDVSVGLVPIPLWIPQVFMALGVILLEIAVLEQLLLLLSGHEPVYRRFEDAEVDIDKIAAGGE